MQIRAITAQDIPKVQEFLMKHLKELFNKEGQAAITNDVWGLEGSYIVPERNNMWGAYDENDELIGTIAIAEYNGRIVPLKGRYDLPLTAEIGRCYINENMRRKGIGKQLLDVAEEFCLDKGYKIIYLHTHHFLPGGYNFWKKNDFLVVLDEGGSYDIVHMEKKL